MLIRYILFQILDLDIQELIVDFATPLPVNIMSNKQNRKKILQAESLLSPEHNFNLYK